MVVTTHGGTSLLVFFTPNVSSPQPSFTLAIISLLPVRKSRAQSAELSTCGYTAHKLQVYLTSVVIPCKGLSIKIFLNFFLSDRQFFLTVIHIQLTPFSFLGEPIFCFVYSFETHKLLQQLSGAYLCCNKVNYGSWPTAFQKQLGRFCISSLLYFSYKHEINFFNETFSVAFQLRSTKLRTQLKVADFPTSQVRCLQSLQTLQRGAQFPVL